MTVSGSLGFRNLGLGFLFLICFMENRHRMEIFWINCDQHVLNFRLMILWDKCFLKSCIIARPLGLAYRSTLSLCWPFKPFFLPNIASVVSGTDQLPIIFLPKPMRLDRLLFKYKTFQSNIYFLDPLQTRQPLLLVAGPYESRKDSQIDDNMAR